jgi:hypothetical protein
VVFYHTFLVLSPPTFVFQLMFFGLSDQSWCFFKFRSHTVEGMMRCLRLAIRISNETRAAILKYTKHKKPVKIPVTRRKFNCVPPEYEHTHPASYRMGTGGSVPGDKAARRKQTIHFQLVPMIRIRETTTSLPHTPSCPRS